MLAAAFALLAVAAATDYGSLVPKIHSTVKDAVNTVSLHHDGSHFRRSSDPPMPSIPSEFNVSVALIMSFDFGAGPMSYSLSQKSMRIDTSTDIDGFAPQTINYTWYYLPHGLFIDINDVCRADGDDSQGFSDLFVWLKYASFAGERVIDGRQCNEWVLLTSTANLSLCATNDRPVELRYNLTYYPYIYGYAFGDDFHAGEQNASAFIVPSRCYNETICPGAPNSTEYISAYIFHPKNTTGMIENQDVADLLGDTAFICEDAATNHTDFDSYEYVTLYILHVVDTWGQYQACNDYPGVCMGFDSPAVGREATFAMFEDAGQCRNNSDVGTWYSLPAAGACQKGDVLDLRKNCTWYIDHRVKTIDGKCLLQTQGMLESCLAEKTFPFAKTQQILLTAFQEDDVALGGCPNVVPFSNKANPN